MKSLKHKILACILATVLAFGMCPTAAFAANTNGQSERSGAVEPNVPTVVDPDAPNVTTEGGTGTTDVYILTDQTVDPSTFAIAEHTANPVQKSEVKSGAVNSLWVNTQNGKSPYTAKWERIYSADENFSINDSSWQAGTSGYALLSESEVQPQNVPAGQQGDAKFGWAIAMDDFPNDGVYYYRVTVTDSTGSANAQSYTFKVNFVDQYHGGTIEDGDENPSIWQVSGYEFNDASMVAQLPSGSIHKRTWLEYAQLTNSADSDFSAIYSAAAAQDETTLGVWQLMIDGDENIPSDEALYIDDVLVTMHVPEEMINDGNYSVWWKYGDTLTQINSAPLSNSKQPQVGSLKINHGENGDTITFLISGTGAKLGTFGISKDVPQEVKQFTITPKVSDSTGGQVIPAQAQTFTEGDGVARTFVFQSYEDWEVDNVVLQRKSGAPIVVPKAGSDAVVNPEVGEWSGNTYTIPDSWTDDATLTVTFAQTSNVNPPTDEDGNEETLSADVSAGANGAVFVGEKKAANKVSENTSAQFATSYSNTSDKFQLKVNEAIQLFFEPATVGTAYRAKTVKIKPHASADSEYVSYAVSGDSFTTPKLQSSIDIYVEFEEYLGGGEVRHNVAAVVDAASPANSGSVVIEGTTSSTGTVLDAQGVTFVATALPGFQLASAAIVDNADNQLTDMTDAVRSAQTTAAGTQYTLRVAPVLSDLRVSFTFEPAPISVFFDVPDGAGIDVLGQPEFDKDGNPVVRQDGSPIEFAVTPDASHDVLSVSMGGNTLSPTSMQHNDNGIPVYIYRIIFEDAQRGNTVNVVLSQVVVEDPTSPDVPVGEDTSDKTITARTEGGGKALPASATVEYNGSATIDFMPDEGNKLVAIRVVKYDSHGNEISNKRFEWQTPSYTVSEIRGNIDVVAYFEPKDAEDGSSDWADQIGSYTVSVQASAGGVVKPESDVAGTHQVRINEGSWRTFTFTPDAGMEVGDVFLIDSSGNSKLVASGQTSYQLKPAGDCTLQVNFVAAAAGESGASGNARAEVESAVQVFIQTDNTFLETTLENWEDILSVDPMSKSVKMGDSASFIVRINRTKGYVFKGITAESDGLAVDVSFRPIVDGEVLDTEYVYSAASQMRLVRNMARQATAQAIEDYEAYLVTIKTVNAKTTMSLKLQSEEDYTNQTGVSAETISSGLTNNIYIQSTGDGIVGVFDASGAQLTNIPMVSGYVERISVTPNRGAYVKKALLFTGNGVSTATTIEQLSSLPDVSMDDVTNMARGGTVSILGGNQDTRLVVEFAHTDVVDGVAVNVLNSAASDVSVDGAKYKTYTSTFTKADGSVQNVRFYMTPNASEGFPRNVAQNFTFRIIDKQVGTYAIDTLILNGETASVTHGADYVQLPMDGDSNLLLTFRELGEDETPITTDVRYKMNVEQPTGAVIAPSTHEVALGASPVFQITPVDTGNNPIQNVIEAVLLDGHYVYPQYDSSYFDYDSITGVYAVKETGEKFIYDAGASKLSLLEVSGSHSVAAEVFRAVGVLVDYEAEAENGLVVPNGEVWWPVDDEDVPQSLRLYVAPRNGYALKSFTVNNIERTPFEAEEANDAIANWQPKELRPMAAYGVAKQVSNTAHVGYVASESASLINTVRELVSVDTAYADEVVYGAGLAYDLTRDDFPTEKYVKVAAKFELPQHQSTFDVNVEVVGGDSGHGSIQLSSSRLVSQATFNVKAGDSQSIKFAPNVGYIIAELTDNGIDVTANVRDFVYTLAHVSERHDIKVTFKRVLGPAMGTDRAVKQLASLAKTGDLNAPALTLLLGIACAAVGVAIFSSSRRKRC
ncbi:hypothetical protein [Adlercreutzia sp. ZJ304]|uniref:hypothetical protein n=1 Tax=Adlercreutzia sp. ZJ304 TaxID=2709791 RepID=UPI0013EA2A3C|nr:hypothetical protein [Adlercreutzia sp. ZJ304]